MNDAFPGLLSREVREDPYPCFRWLLAERPVYHDPKAGYWALSRYQDVLAAARNCTVFSSAQGAGIAMSRGRTIMSTDPPGHTRLRALVSRAFQPGMVDALAPRMEAMCHGLIDASAAARGRFDLIEDFAAPFPVMVTDRVRRSGHAKDATIVEMPEAPRNAVVELYRAELARSPMTTPWSLLDQICAPRFVRSPVMLVGGRVAGFLLWDIDGELSKIPTRIVAPEFQGGPASVLMMDDALRKGWDGGVREVEFDIPKDNSDTEKLARRFEARVIRTSDQYFRKL